MSLPAPAPECTPARRPDGTARAAAAILAAGTIAIYARTFSVPLLFDDSSWLTDNPSLRHLRDLGAILSPPPGSGVGGRPFLNLTYALNYATGGAQVGGYHAVNLLIHVLAAWTLFALVRRTLRRPVLAERFAPAATFLALAISAIWAWHPLQTEAVTYLAERSESLMGLCYLLTLYCFLRGAEAEGPGGRRTWFSLSVLACLAGVGSKEVIVTAPLLVLLYDRTFLSGSLGSAWRRHWAVYLALAATWLPLGHLMSGLRLRGVGFGPNVSGWAYGLAECRVVVKYLLLTLWPRPLIFDYGTFAAPHFSQIWPYALILIVLLAATAAAMRGAPAAGFAACWFFLILTPTSSIVPVVAQPMAENRLYLPLAGVVALVVLGIFALIGRRSLLLFAALAAGLGAASAARNRDYQSEPGIWIDAIAKLPQNARAHGNLAAAWLKVPGRLGEAVAEYAVGVRLEPWNAQAHYNLGYALDRAGRTGEARAQYEEAVRLNPGLAQAHESLGDSWYASPGRLSEALAEYRKAERLEPNLPGVHNDLGNAWYAMPGRMTDAIAEYREALRLNPEFPEAHNNLGNALLYQPGQLDNAIAEYETALRLKPDYADAHMGLALALLRRPGRTAEARGELKIVLRLQPGNPAAAHLLDTLPPAPR